MLAGARGAGDDGDRDGASTSDARSASSRDDRRRGRLRRDEPAPRPDRGGRDLRTPEGRDRSPRSTSSIGAWPAGAELASSTRPADASARRRARAPPAASGSRCSAIAGSLPVVRPPARRRARHGGDRLRRQARRRRPRRSPARAGSTRRPRSARPRSASRARAPAAGVPCVAVGGGVTPEGIDALAAARRRRRPGRGAAAIDRGGDGRRRRARRALRRTDRPPGVHHGRAMTDREDARPDRAAGRAKPKPAEEATRSRIRSSPGRGASIAYRPGLVDFTLDELAGLYGHPEWVAPPRPDERADPHDPHPEHRRHERRGRVRARSARPTRRASRRSTTTRARAGAAAA